MYCVKCGVKLPEGALTCPLCRTPVIYPDGQPAERLLFGYPARYPKNDRRAAFVMLGLASAVMLSAALTCFIICIRMYHRAAWSGIVMLGLAAAWILFVFPFCFRRRPPLVFISVDTAVVCGLLLYLCASHGQHWFLGFAFPVTTLAGIFAAAAYVLFRYIRRGRLYIAGALMIAAGGFCMLIELFQHITFGSEMFLWSLYCAGIFTVIGLFLIAAATISPLAAYLERKFFF